MRMVPVCLIAIALTAPLAAQQPKPITAEGTEAFRAVVGQYGMHPIKSLDDITRVNPARTLIISFRGETKGVANPDLLSTIQPERYLVEFVNKGGAVFVATDVSTRDLPWADSLGIDVLGNQVTGRRGFTCYRADPHFPLVGNAQNAKPDLFTSDAAGSIRKLSVATNNPSCLRQVSPLESLGWFVLPCKVAGLDQLKGLVPFAQGQNYENGGRILALSDHSVFINGMMLPPGDYPNDNLEFAQNCLNWLTVGPNGEPRDRVLFINDGVIETDFEFSFSEAPAFSPADFIKALMNHPGEAWKLLADHPEMIGPMIVAAEDSGMISNLEENNIFNEVILNTSSLWQIVKAALAVATAGLLGYAAMKFLGSKWKSSKKIPRLALALERFRPRVGMLEQRLRDGMAAAQYYEAARERAQLLFADLNLTPAAEGPPPQYTIVAGWLERGRIDRELREIWNIAFGLDPIPVPGKVWAKWPTRLAKLKDWIQTGVIRFMD